MKWRKTQLPMMPSVASLIAENESMREDVENIDLLLPSSFSSEDREHLQLANMAQLEYHLHEGEAHDTLDNLRISLRFLAVIDHKKGRERPLACARDRGGKKQKQKLIRQH